MKPYNVVIRQLGGLGDMLMCSAVFRGLKEKYTDHETHAIVGQDYLAGCLVDLARHNPLIDRIHIIDPYTSTTKRTTEVQPALRGAPPTLLNERICRMAENVWDLNQACIEYENTAMHTPGGVAKSRNQIWCDAVGVKPSSYHPIYCITPDERRWAQLEYGRRGWLDGKPIVGVSLTCVDRSRAIGHRKLLAIMTALQERGCRVVSVDLRTDTDGRFESIFGERIDKTIAMLERMSLFISADTGILHAAGAVGVPVIGLFGPTDPRMRVTEYRGSSIDSQAFMPCAFCWYKMPCKTDPNEVKRFECLNKIPVSVVVEESMRWLEKTHAFRNAG